MKPYTVEEFHHKVWANFDEDDAARMIETLNVAMAGAKLFSSYHFMSASQVAVLLGEAVLLREALASIAANTCCDGCREAAHVARAVLESLSQKGQDK